MDALPLGRPTFQATMSPIDGTSYESIRLNG